MSLPSTEAHVRAQEIEDRRRTYLTAHGLLPADHGEAAPLTPTQKVALLQELGFEPEEGLPQDELHRRVETEGVRAAGVERRHLFSHVHDLGEYPFETFEDWARGDRADGLCRGAPRRGCRRAGR